MRNAAKPNPASTKPKEGRLQQMRTWLAYTLIAVLCIGVPIGVV
jgi:hypothetical protein